MVSVTVEQCDCVYLLFRSAGEKSDDTLRFQPHDKISSSKASCDISDTPTQIKLILSPGPIVKAMPAEPISNGFVNLIERLPWFSR